jgi:hypothetical protein
LIMDQNSSARPSRFMFGVKENGHESQVLK